MSRVWTGFRVSGGGMGTWGTGTPLVEQVVAAVTPVAIVAAGSNPQDRMPGICGAMVVEPISMWTGWSRTERPDMPH